VGGDGYSELSFREPDRWWSMSTSNTASRVAGTALNSGGILLGDDETGPAVLLLALGPGVTPPDAPAHMHASDNWRMSLLGNLPMGPDRYDPGEFRFQEGWKPYASDNYAHGPDGGWTLLVFGDRRGMRVRHVRHEGPDITPMDRLLAEWMGVRGDLVSNDPADTAGPAALATTLDEFRRGARLNASFADTEHWMSFDGLDVMAGAIGERETGPVIVLAKVAAGRPGLSGAAFDCDVLRVVASGSCVLDGKEYVAGDMRVQSAGVPLGDVTAGPDGADEVIIIADRRRLDPTVARDSVWIDALTALQADLAARLTPA
jgi:hypothetical protein